MHSLAVVYAMAAQKEVMLWMKAVIYAVLCLLR